MSKGLLSKKTEFLLILAVFVMLYASVTFDFPLLRNMGLGVYALLILSHVKS